MKIFKICFIAILLGIPSLGSIDIAGAEGYPWRDHAKPFDFLIGNHFDNHQQSQVQKDGKLQGFLYVNFTGSYLEGFPIAVHGNESVGWILKGVPIQAKLLSNEGNQHPTWCINPADLPPEQGYTHFHWLNGPEHADGLEVGSVYEGYLLKLTAREAFFFEHQGGFYVTPGIDYYTHDNIVTNCQND